ncbi:MAG: energy transducer TonB [Xanthomonadales bacterium]|nr:energy transducer TonB [Xanthomonadales bacterium]
MSEADPITTDDRLSVTVVFALMLHAVVVLGVSFTYEEPDTPDNLPSLDVILVQRKSETPPDEADYLAQASQVGGGTEVEKVRPQSPITGQLPKPDPGIAPAPTQPSTPNPQKPSPADLLTRQDSTTRVVKTEEQKPIPDTETPTARELIDRSVEIARLEAEIGRELQAYARRPRRKFISANTREFEFASYMQAWVAKVERIGNLNYPSEARRRDLEGSLVLTVAISRDGSVESIDIIQPSGFPVLDDAAIRIVRLGAPYAPLPATMRESVDILHITRTWQFLPGNVLRHN